MLFHDAWQIMRVAYGQDTVRFTSMNPGLFREINLLISSGSIWARDKPNTNFHILIPRALIWAAYQIFTPKNSTADIRQNTILSHLFDLLEIFFAFEKFEIFFHQISSFRYPLWIIRSHFNISSKNGHQSMDSF